jgi:hypothetical protein
MLGMAYQHDVFISYRRELLWTPWTRDHFKKLLSCYLQQELGRQPEIFVDERIVVGADWVDDLGEHLATSAVLVAIFSGDYFGSDWCLHELDLMLERSRAVPKAKPDDARLIIPVVVHDGELIPQPVKRLQPAQLDKYRIAYICEQTPDYHEFSKAMKALAPAVAAAIRNAPDDDPTWIAHHQGRFNEVFEAQESGTTLDPRQFVAKRPVPPTAPPRLY